MKQQNHNKTQLKLMDFIMVQYRLNISNKILLKILAEHVKELLFKYCVINYLYEQIRNNKLVVVGDPRLIDIKIKTK